MVSVPHLPLDAVRLELPRCEDVATRLSEYLDGDVDATSARRIALHLAICPACATLASELAAVVRALHALGGLRCRR